MQYLKQSTSVTLKIGPFLDETDGKTAEEGLTIAQADVRLSKNGADLAQKTESTSCTHDELGIYGCPLDTTDTDTLGRLQLWVHEAGALPILHEFMVVPANVFDSMFSTDKLEVDLLQMGGVAQSATDLKDFADSGYDPSAHRTQSQVKTMDSGVVTATAIAADAIGASEFAQAAADKVWATAARALTDKAGFALSAAGITSIWEKNISAYAGAGYAGTYLKTVYDDWLNGGRLDLILDAITDRFLMQETTIATLTSQTSFTLTAGSADDDAYNNCTIVIEDASTATQKAVGLISNYVGASKTVTLKYDPVVFTMAVTDKVYILADNSLKSAAANRQFDVASDGSGHPTVFSIANQVWDELQSGHVDAGSFGKYLDVEVSTVAAAIGSGLLSCTWTQNDGQGHPMDNVQIWITTDEAGSNVVAGALYTDTAGEATFMLDAGTYYVWREKGGYNFSNPQTWTVS